LGEGEKKKKKVTASPPKKRSLNRELYASIAPCNTFPRKREGEREGKKGEKN